MTASRAPAREMPPLTTKLPGARPAALNESWAGSPGKDLMWASYSLMFPEGELFFIRSLKAAVGDIADPRVRRDAESFIAQEAYHSTEHRHLNALLGRLGADVEGFSAYFRDVRLELEREPLLHRLARVSAAEHLTSVTCLAAHRSGWLDGCKSEEVRRLWYWHVQEELEHRHVCLDVYRALGGSYRLRAGIYLRVVPRMAWHQVRAMHACLRGRPLAQRLRTYLSLAWMLLGMRGKLASLRELVAYLGPSYDARDLPGDPVIAFCRETFRFAPVEAPAKS